MDDGTGRRTLSIAAAMVTAARAQWEQMGMTPPVDVLDAFSSAAFSAAGVLMGHPNPRVAELESQLAEVTAERDGLRAILAEAHDRNTAELTARRAAGEGAPRRATWVELAHDDLDSCGAGCGHFSDGQVHMSGCKVAAAWRAGLARNGPWWSSAEAQS